MHFSNDVKLERKKIKLNASGTESLKQPALDYINLCALDGTVEGFIKLYYFIKWIIKGKLFQHICMKT